MPYCTHPAPLPESVEWMPGKLLAHLAVALCLSDTPATEPDYKEPQRADGERHEERPHIARLRLLKAEGDKKGADNK